MKRTEFRRDRLERERREAVIREAVEAATVEEAVEADIAAVHARDASAGWADLTQEEADTLVASGVASGSGDVQG